MTTSRSTRPFRWTRRANVLIAGMASVAALATAGCQDASPRGELGESQQILASCDSAAPPASLIEIDGTGSSHSDSITSERMATIESIVRTTAICSGHLRVLVFSASSVDTITLFDGSLRLDGATDNARLRRAPALVDEVMGQIREAYGPALAGLSPGGSDVTSQYRLASEWVDQLDPGLRLHLYLLTDGFHNVGVDLGARPLDQAEAAALAGQLEMPELTGASVVVAGLGRVVGTPPSSEVVEGLVTFYDALCQQTGAERCLSVSDYSAGR